MKIVFLAASAALVLCLGQASDAAGLRKTLDITVCGDALPGSIASVSQLYYGITQVPCYSDPQFRLGPNWVVFKATSPGSENRIDPGNIGGWIPSKTTITCYLANEVNPPNGSRTIDVGYSYQCQAGYTSATNFITQALNVIPAVPQLPGGFTAPGPWGLGGACIQNGAPPSNPSAGTMDPPPDL